MNKQLTSIDLFAGCGGLSLGLEQAGFQTIFVNELNPDAMESFLINRQHNPYLKNPENRAYDLLEITQDPEALESLRERLHSEFGDIGVVCGGPPCQGYSGIGHRSTFKELNTKKEDIPTNHLYKEMAIFIQELAPRAFIFENVKGLLTAKRTSDGEPKEFWKEIWKEFNDICTIPPGKEKELGYVVQHKTLLAKDYGVPQNRPRVIMIGIREDVHAQLLTEIQNKIKNTSEKSEDTFFPQKTNGVPDLIDVIGDLIDDDYVGGSSTTEYPKDADLKNKTQKNLRRKSRKGSVAKKGDPLTEHDYSKHSPKVVQKFEGLIKSGKPIRGSEQKERANKECQSYIERKNESEKLKKKFIDDFAPLFNEDQLLKIRKEFSSADPRTRYIKILDRVEQEVIEHTGVDPHKTWLGASVTAKSKIKENLKRLETDKEYEKSVLAGDKLPDFKPLWLSTVFRIEEINKEPDPSRKLKEAIKTAMDGKPPSEKFENLPPDKKNLIRRNLKKIQNKKKYQSKFAQRPLPERWDENGPNITITGGTEDLIHFSQPRTLTVREWARLQGFPDWYQFAGPRTTGGRRRAGDPSKEDWTRDLPKYTQIGNAVPVKLAREIGNHLRELLDSKD